VSVNLLLNCLLLALGACFTGCSPSGGQPGGASELVGAGGSGDFRGMHLGDDRDMVRKKESNAAVYAMPDELVYRLPQQQGAPYSHEISYMFDENGLYDIDMRISAKNDSVIDALRQDILELYTTRYGAPRSEEDRQIWKAISISGRYIRVVLQDAPGNHAPSVLNLKFHESE